ncbi:MAG: ferrochelatase [Promethearchaeota archaeon]
MTPKIGVLLLGFGEPPEYNEHTYYSFRNLGKSLIDMGIIPKIALRAKRGTILMERDNIFSKKPNPKPDLIDAWLKPHTEFTKFIPSRNKIFGLIPAPRQAHYLLSGIKPHLDEPDFYQFYGFTICRKWLLMDNHSPFYDQTQPQKIEVKRRLEKKYGDQLLIRFAYGNDPFPEKKIQSPHHVVKELINGGCEGIAVAEHFHVISDSMSKHYCRQSVLNGIHQTGIHIPIVFADQIGDHKELIWGIVLKIREELSSIEHGTDVAIFLSNHGFPNTKIGHYDAASDCYHNNAKKVFENTEKAIQKNVEWSGRLKVEQVFAEYTEEKYNPRGIKTKPLDAIKDVVADGFQQVIDIPYEWPGDTVDTLINLRYAYGINPPFWDKNFETKFESNGIPIKICSALFFTEYRINAYFERACEAVDQCISLLKDR